MVGVFAELERALIRERVMAGLARAKAQGKKLGRRPTDSAIERQIERALTRGGCGIRKIARELGVGVGPKCLVSGKPGVTAAGYLGAIALARAYRLAKCRWAWHSAM